MSNNGTSRSSSELESARYLMSHRDVYWHALRGIDLAGLAEALDSGIKPTNQGGAYNASGSHTAVALSRSPVISRVTGRGPMSLRGYTFSGSISLAVTKPNDLIYEFDSGFDDEVRVGHVIHPDQILAVMIPSELADMPLHRIRTNATLPRSVVVPGLVERTVRYFADHGSDLLADELRNELNAVLSDEDLDHRGRSSAFFENVNSAHARHLARQGLPDATLRQVVGSIVGNSLVQFVTWDEALKTKLLTGYRPGIRPLAKGRIREVEWLEEAEQEPVSLALPLAKQGPTTAIRTSNIETTPVLVRKISAADVPLQHSRPEVDDARPELQF
jgi:hypothetical protein